MNCRNRLRPGLALAGSATVLCLLSAFQSHSAEETDSGWNPSTPLPPGESGRVVALGKQIVVSTNGHPLSKPYVNNALTCKSCHLDAGTHPRAATFLDTVSAYPSWSPRERRGSTLEHRVLNCFVRSMNGVRPPNESRVSVAVTACITWLSSGRRIRKNPERPLGPRHVRPLDIDPQRADPERPTHIPCR